MLRRPALALVLGLLPAATFAVPAGIDEYLQAEMRLNALPGLAVAVVEQGTVSYLRSFGVRSIESRQALDRDTPLDLASVSKAFTALAVLQAERAGLVSQDALAGDYLPTLRTGNWASVTVRHLLRHRSGLRRRHDFLVPCCGEVGALDLGAVGTYLASADLESPPGATFAYANSNYVALAAIVERVTGVPFPDFMREEVFRPLGLRHTTVRESEARSWGLADRHEWLWGRVAVSPSRSVGWHGSSGVKSSAADIGTYIAALLDPRFELVTGGGPGPPWWRGLETEYDLGWAVQSASDWLGGELVLEHTGKLWGVHTAVAVSPERTTGVGVLINLGTDRADRIARAILRSLDGAPLAPPGRMSRAERPDAWAIAILGASVALFAGTLAYAYRVWQQVRAGLRFWQKTPRGLLRAGILGGLAITLVYAATWGSATPFAAYPSTIRVALPALVSSVTLLLLAAAAASVFSRSAPATVTSRQRR